MAPDPNTHSTGHRRPGLLTARAALILLLSLLSGAGCAVLLLAAGRALPEVILGSIGVVAGALKLFHELID
ncbi:hypothetical protein BJY14_007751 [Actinomadura luteofluorescens]|uniref:Uncharacterized protein n=1 Tax=Actinomadura luteofluorescens TaxID=46163 RepID=A0A7Y9EPW6_9ACTN|nr:hypothetical protein [Actinomadura luteofluorescens]NYD51768.1 hypothetical protein [Actinomadura luteofluorescens]